MDSELRLGFSLSGFTWALSLLCGRREGERARVQAEETMRNSSRDLFNLQGNDQTNTTFHSQIEKTAPTRRQSPAKARPAEPRIARSQSAALRAECGLARRRRQSGSCQRGWTGQEWADEGYEGQEEEDDQGGQLLEGDGLERNRFSWREGVCFDIIFGTEREALYD